MGNWACWTSIQVYSNNYFILSIFYITITNRSWHIATLSNDKESTKPLCLRSNTKAKEKKSDYNVFDLLLVRGLFSFCPSLTLFSFPASLSLHCHCQPFNLSASVHKNVLVYFIFLLFLFPIFFQNFPLVLFFFFFFLLLFPSPGKHYYKNDCNKSAIPISVKKKDAESAMFTLSSFIWSFLSMYFLCSLCSKLWWISSSTHTHRY